MNRQQTQHKHSEPQCVLCVSYAVNNTHSILLDEAKLVHDIFLGEVSYPDHPTQHLHTGIPALDHAYGRQTYIPIEPRAEELESDQDGD